MSSLIDINIKSLQSNNKNYLYDDKHKPKHLIKCDTANKYMLYPFFKALIKHRKALLKYQLKILSFGDIQKYFNKLLKGQLKIMNINGSEFDQLPLDNMIICDICLNPIMGDGYQKLPDLHLCGSCGVSSSPAFIIKHQIKYKFISLAYNNCQFGSLLDWVPFVTDPQGHRLLINLNPMSTYYLRFAMSISPNEIRYYTLSKELTLGLLINRLGQYTEHNLISLMIND